MDRIKHDSAELLFKYITERGLPKYTCMDIAIAHKIPVDELYLDRLLEEHKSRSRNNKFRREIF